MSAKSLGLLPFMKSIEDAHAAVFTAYGWSLDLIDEQILERLLKLNLEQVAR